MNFRGIFASCLLTAAVANATPTTVANRPENAELSARAGNAPPTKATRIGPAPSWAHLDSNARASWKAGQGFSDKTTIFKPGDSKLGDRSIYNPALTYDKRGNLVMLPRMEQTNKDGKTWTSRIGKATSKDGGQTWKLTKKALLAPSRRDPAIIRQYESAGTEDPRAAWVEDTKKTFVTYTMVERRPDGKLVARLGMASGADLNHLKKGGSMFAPGELKKNGIQLGDADMPDWSKAGAVFPKQIVASDPEFLKEFPADVADEIRGKKVYVMAFGDRTMHIAVSLSGDAGTWHPTPKPLISAMPGKKDGLMVEPGAPPFYDKAGNIRFFYNADGNSGPTYKGGYGLFEAELSPTNPMKVIARSHTPRLLPTRPEEMNGQVNSVVFTPGTAIDPKTGDMLFVSGMADSQTEITRIPQSLDPNKRLSQPMPYSK
jgi:predicted GH43/DUF377 family glycosyl hydrolase